MKLALACAAAAAPFVFSGSADAQAAGRAVDRAVAAYERVSTIRAEFIQNIANPLTGTRMTSRGTFLSKKPGRIAIMFSNPAGDRIVADGRAVWVYVPSTAPGQVVKLAPKNPTATRVDPASQFLDQPRERFTITDAGPAMLRGRGTRQVILLPRDGVSAAFSRARLWIDDADGMIRQFELTEPSGLVREVQITRITLGAPIPRGTFEFVPPAGTRVVDQQSMFGNQ